MLLSSGSLKETLLSEGDKISSSLRCKSLTDELGDFSKRPAFEPGDISLNASNLSACFFYLRII